MRQALVVKGPASPRSCSSAWTDGSPYPDRILAHDGFEKQLAQRTLTKLSNERPAWLTQAHETLGAAAAAAYGWTDYTPQMPDDEILQRLLALNRVRAKG